MPTVKLLAHKHFMSDLPRELRPAVHACLHKLTQVAQDRWHAAGVRVKKLAGFAYPVFEARLNDGDRLIFSFNRAMNEHDREASLHVVLWHAGHHDDAVRKAGRRMGLQDAVVEDLCEVEADANALGLSWQGVERLGGVSLLNGASVGDENAYVDVYDEENREQLRGLGSLVEVDETEIDLWAERQLDPLLHLTPEQRALTRTGKDKAIFLRGGVGTGKTTVLLYRMLKLILSGSITRPLFITYSRSLAAWCESIYERLPGRKTARVTFTSLSALLETMQPAPRRRRPQELFESIWSKRRLPGDPASAWRELRRLRGSSAFHGRQPWTGDDLPDDADGSLKTAYSEYRKKLGRDADVMDMVWKAYEHFVSPQAAAKLPYDAVFIDEAQDLTPVEWLVCVLLGDRPGLAFFCADEAQDILDTRFTWSGVEGAMKLIGHRAPGFFIRELSVNERNSQPIAGFLRKLSNDWGLVASPACSGERPGPPPLVCTGTRDDLERLAREGGCPILLDLGDQDASGPVSFFRSLDLDHIKGLEFQVLPVWLPQAAWPADKRESRRLYTALSRALQVLLIVTDPASAQQLEAMGAARVAAADAAAVLAKHRELTALDREAVVRWNPPSFVVAKAWVEEGTCTWEDFRSQLPKWASSVSPELASAWVAGGLCSWDDFRDRIPAWVNWANPEQAVAWVRGGLGTRADFALRIPVWVRRASLEQAVAWVQAGLCIWEDFRLAVQEWMPSATLDLADAWVHAGIRTWEDFRSDVPAWMPEAGLWQAADWVNAGLCTWTDLRHRLPEWTFSATLELAAIWVGEGLCSWSDFWSRIPGWMPSASLEQAAAWVEAGFCTWEEFRGRIPSWVPFATLAQAEAWVSRGICTWEQVRERIPEWIPIASHGQALTWLQGNLCRPSDLQDRIPEWAGVVTFEQAAELVRVRCCRWSAFQSRLPEWIPVASVEQAWEWVHGRLRGWKEFASRIPEWTSSATLGQASVWVDGGHCGWRDFAARIPAWIPDASFEHADAWVEEGLATWKDFESKLVGWASAAPPEQVVQWREMNLISRQVARARLRR